MHRYNEASKLDALTLNSRNAYNIEQQSETTCMLLGLPELQLLHFTSLHCISVFMYHNSFYLRLSDPCVSVFVYYNSFYLRLSLFLCKIIRSMRGPSLHCISVFMYHSCFYLRLVAEACENIDYN